MLQTTLQIQQLPINFKKENQQYHSQLDQQYIGCKNNGGLEQVTIELMVPSIILKEEKQMLRRI